MGVGFTQAYAHFCHIMQHFYQLLHKGLTRKSLLLQSKTIYYHEYNSKRNE